MKLQPLLLCLGMAGLLLSGCSHTAVGWRSFSAPKLTKTRCQIAVQQHDGSTRPGWVVYHHTAKQPGTSESTAVEVFCYNMISGDHAEQDILRTRFPEARTTRMADAQAAKRTYHCYNVLPKDGQSFVFWIDATDYHQVF